jgi:hypothetical protein
MYKHHPSIVLGFHACEREIGEAILAGTKGFKASENSFDWLGHGMYFWENSPHRAEAYGQELKTRPSSSVNNPMVIGAVINLGYCFDLLESHSLSNLKDSYQFMCDAYQENTIEVPVNYAVSKNDNDKLYRKLDCAVFQYMHSVIKIEGKPAIDTVRGAFWEGEDLYPTAGFKEKNHIQICVRNPNCIKGYFRPIELDPESPRV